MSQKSSGTKHRGARQLRERKQKKLYSEDWALGDDDELDGGRRTFSLQEKLEEPGFEAHGVVREMRGEELTVAHMQRYGFSTPLLFKDKAGLGIRVPSSDFTINDVRGSVGSRRLLDVMDVSTQKNQEMTMKDWQKYYEDPNKDKLLNVISLEFSHTKLENYVQSPTIVRQIDWVDNVWPRHLKEQQTESTNLLEDMKYPKVQKYCLMSVKGCYTDFHIDFGGTSVWYHILKGCKVFWLIPPTEHNIDLYERWCLSGKQSDIFFGDTVEKCARIFLQEGNTFFIPTGWIHAVYTPLDSLVFGGNFLHSFGIEKQLKIAQVEDTTKVPHKYRYPFFTEMLWYVLERYVHCLLGNSHLASGEDAPIPPERQHIHLTQGELHGLKEIVKYLHMLPSHRKNLPELIRDPIALIQDVRTLIGLHRQDSRELAISGKSVLSLPEDQNGKKPSGIRGPYQKSQNIDKLNHDKPPKPHNNFKGPKTSPGSVSGDKGGGPRRRRTRCKKCSACMRSDCGECSFCLDMVKFGGPGRAKQTCNMRQCLQPMLPVTAACARCGLDGWMQTPVALLQKGSIRCDGPSNLMECSVCYEIAHPACVQRLCTEFTGYINEDMPNSWECPLCCKLGKNTDYRPRHFRARQKSSEIMRRTSISSDASSAFEQKIHQETDSENENETKEYTELLPIKKRRSSESSEIDTKVTPPPNVNDTRKTALRMQLAQQIASNSTKQLKKPMVVVRPAPLVPANPPVPSNNLAMDKRVILKVFRYLTPADLLISALVCKTWSTYSIDPSLWKYMIFDRKRISSDMLKGIVRRQPESLSLNWCRINHFQLPWLIQRLNNLKQLFLQSLDVKTAISLRTNHSAILNVLDLSFITDFNDSALREILGSTNDARAGLTNDKIRFRNLKSLLIAGTDVTDITLRYVTQYCPNLQHLSLSMCPRISDAGIAQISTKPATTVTNLISLDLSHTKMVTETSLEHLARCEKLTRLDCRHALNITTQALIKFAAKSKHDLQVREIKLVDIRQK